MQLYLANRETEFILFRPIRAQILTAFMTLITTLKAEYTPDQEIVVACPNQARKQVYIKLYTFFCSIYTISFKWRSRQI